MLVSVVEMAARDVVETARTEDDASVIEIRDSGAVVVFVSVLVCTEVVFSTTDVDVLVYRRINCYSHTV